MDITFIFIGWCNEDNHDKLWIAFEVGGGYYCAWGRRGAKLSFKKHTKYSLETITRKKKSSYNPVEKFVMYSMRPDFEEALQQELVFDTLRGKVM